MTRLLAWAVHAFTALGLVAAAGMAVLIFRGGDASFRGVFALMWAATLVDACDGTLARWARVGKVLPGFDGRRLDDIIDFQTYTSLPLLLMWRAAIVPEGWSALLMFPLVASAFGFSRVAAKTEDGYFLGFPSYWNIVAFYLYFLSWPQWINAGITIVLAALTFVPARYLYTTNPGTLNRITNLLAVPWAAILIGALLANGSLGRILVEISLYFPVYYTSVSWWISMRRAGLGG